MTDVKFPQCSVKLVGEDGNAFAILGRCQAALRRGGVSPEEVNAFFEEATRGTYDHLLAVVIATLVTDGDEDPLDGAGDEDE